MREACYGQAAVESVEPGSPAADAGIRAGDSILRIDGERLRDLIDCYLLFADDVPHRCLLRREGDERELMLDCGGRPAGITFENPVFGEVTLCRNHCMFCFVDQMPPGLRDTFYVKDDDYRLSFLGGNFVTLTNMGRADVRRVVEERLSPLYVSLHAVEKDVRRRLFGRGGTERALGVLESLTDVGIEVHVQIVLVRGVNDGAHLDRTLDYLLARPSSIRSIGVVPVGVSTGGVRQLDPRYGFEAGSSAEVLRQLEPWRGRFGEQGPYAADEFFFMAGEAQPPTAYYRDGFPQLENGIGLASSFLDGAGAPAEGLAPKPGVAVITTSIGAWALAPLGLERLGVPILQVANSLFGPAVTVCGLMTGRDLATALSGAPEIKTALLPQVALSEQGAFVDGVTLSGVAAETGVEMIALPADASLLIESALTAKGGG